MKKLKLFLSICMLCFCISFLYFGMYGVYAAQSVTYSISGTITYEKENPFYDLLETYTNNDNNYWVVPLGKIASDSDTPIF